MGRSPIFFEISLDKMQNFITPVYLTHLLRVPCDFVTVFGLEKKLENLCDTPVVSSMVTRDTLILQRNYLGKQTLLHCQIHFSITDIHIGM